MPRASLDQGLIQTVVAQAQKERAWMTPRRRASCPEPCCRYCGTLNRPTQCCAPCTQTSSSLPHQCVNDTGALVASIDPGLKGQPQVFRELRRRGLAKYTVRVSYVEIYNEGFRDLLIPDTRPADIGIVETRSCPGLHLGLELSNCPCQLSAI